jgi:hypothetical protein
MAAVAASLGWTDECVRPYVVRDGGWTGEGARLFICTRHYSGTHSAGAKNATIDLTVATP